MPKKKFKTRYADGIRVTLDQEIARNAVADSIADLLLSVFNDEGEQISDRTIDAALALERVLGVEKMIPEEGKKW